MRSGLRWVTGRLWMSLGVVSKTWNSLDCRKYICIAPRSLSRPCCVLAGRGLKESASREVVDKHHDRPIRTQGGPQFIHPHPLLTLSHAEAYRLVKNVKLRHCYFAWLDRRSSEGIGVCTSKSSTNPTLAKYNDNLSGMDMQI